MGSDIVDKLQIAIRAEGPEQGGFEGEPDLFCSYPDTGTWFFAEAKGKDLLRETQHRWFRVCRDIIPALIFGCTGLCPKRRWRQKRNE